MKLWTLKVCSRFGSEMNSDTDVLDRLVRRIVDLVQPQKIILFGSAARGEMEPGSDIDVLVVVPEGVHRRKTAQRLYRQIKGLGVPFDIIDIHHWGNSW